MNLYQIIFVEPWAWWAGGAAIGLHMLAFLYFQRRLLSNSATFQGVIEALQGKGDPADPEFVFKVKSGDLPVKGDDPAPRWRVWMFAGLIAGGFLASVLSGSLNAGPELAGMGAFFGLGPLGQLLMLVLGGIFIGFGTRFCGGCTSGHAIVGISGRQLPSLMATAIFFGVGMAVTFAIHWWRAS